MLTDPRPFAKGQDQISAQLLNEIYRVVQRLQFISASPPLNVSQVGNGLNFYIDEGWKLETWIGVLDATGETPYTDEKYWVKRARCSNTTGDETATLTFVAETGGSNPLVLQTTATNLAEMLGGSHLLVEDMVVLVFQVWDAQSPAIKHYYFWADTSDGFWAKITGNAEADAPAQNRWKYAWEQVYKSATGYDGWSTLSGGRSGTTGTDPARNNIEDMNTGVDAHVEGNGVDPENVAAVGTFEMMPCTTDNIVWMRLVTFIVAETTYTEYWFSYENGVDGTC